jgi:hypothetical protein
VLDAIEEFNEGYISAMCYDAVEVATIEPPHCPLPNAIELYVEEFHRGFKAMH